MTLEIINTSFGDYCDPAGYCITCADEALAAKVVAVDEPSALAQVEIGGQISEVDISLVAAVAVGQILLVHGGVALERFAGGDS
jgi:hydrogenase maturation factor